jgi:hypothetical protein
LRHRGVVGRRGDRQNSAETRGRAPPGQNRLRPCAESRSPAAVPGSPAPAPSFAPVLRSSGQTASPDRARPVALTCAMSRPCSQSSRRSNSSLPIAMRDRRHAPLPCAPRVPGLQEKSDFFSVIAPPSQAVEPPANPEQFNLEHQPIMTGLAKPVTAARCLASSTGRPSDDAGMPPVCAQGYS